MCGMNMVDGALEPLWIVLSNSKIKSVVGLVDFAENTFLWKNYDFAPEIQETAFTLNKLSKHTHVICHLVLAVSYAMHLSAKELHQGNIQNLNVNVPSLLSLYPI